AERDPAHAGRAELVVMLGELENGRAEHGRHGEEEAELGGGAPLDAEREAAENGRARAADARDHREALDEADADRLAEADVGDAFLRAFGRRLLDDQDRDTA